MKEEQEKYQSAQAKADIEYEKKVKCIRCNDNGCPACDTESKGSKYNPEPY
jgi:hypothetical protein